MITAKEEAQKLVEDFNCIETDSIYFGVKWAIAKQSALIAVDKLIEEVEEIGDDELKFMRIIYWRRVKREINNL
jgi:hypothetical protein